MLFVYSAYISDELTETNLVNLAGSRDSKSVVWDELDDLQITIVRRFPRLPLARTD